MQIAKQALLDKWRTKTAISKEVFFDSEWAGLFNPLRKLTNR